MSSAAARDFAHPKPAEPEIARAGIGRKFQKPTIFKNHSVFENLEVALKTDKRVFPTLRAEQVIGTDRHAPLPTLSNLAA